MDGIRQLFHRDCQCRLRRWDRVAQKNGFVVVIIDQHRAVFLRKSDVQGIRCAAEQKLISGQGADQPFTEIPLRVGNAFFKIRRQPRHR